MDNVYPKQLGAHLDGRQQSHHDLYELEQNGNGNVAVYLTDDGVGDDKLSRATTPSWPT
jgi:hypothetical protein